MSTTLKIDNFSQVNIKEKTAIDLDVTSGANLKLQSTQNIAADDYVMIGAVGTERAELKQVLSVTNVTDLVLSANISYPHSRYEPLSVLFGNKIKIYRASNVDGNLPADGAFSLLNTIDIDPDNVSTTYIDAAGGSDYWYKFTYYNQTSNAETSLSDSGYARGGNTNVYATVEEIRGQAGLKNNIYISDSLIDQKRIEAQAEIDSTLTGVYTVPFTAPVNPLISQITRLLAAGFVLLNDYGVMTALNTDNGQAMVDKARELLQKLNTKQLVLTNSQGADTSIPGSAGSYSGWPNGDTATASEDEGGGERAFKVSQRF